MAAMRLRLDSLNPAQAWQPWRPSASDPWGRKWAAHLYRRAAFGYSRADLLEAQRLGPEGTLELLLRGRPNIEEMRETLGDIGRVAAERDDTGEQIRGWWLYCMLQGGHPLREKMTLFWHNHFATSIAKVQSPMLMYRQNCLLRQHALGKFAPFLQAISRDGAMLVWLDSNSNVKGKPNENYARELMELFSLGVGNYTEKDIRAAARAFTGWHTDGTGFKFNAALHDDGSQTGVAQEDHVLGEGGLQRFVDHGVAAELHHDRRAVEPGEPGQRLGEYLSLSQRLVGAGAARGGLHEEYAEFSCTYSLDRSLVHTVAVLSPALRSTTTCTWRGARSQSSRSSPTPPSRQTHTPLIATASDFETGSDQPRPTRGYEQRRVGVLAAAR